MNGNDIVRIIESRAFTVFITTLCLILIMQQVKNMIIEIKTSMPAIKTADNSTESE